jgi:hypothetical protein
MVGAENGDSRTQRALRTTRITLASPQYVVFATATLTPIASVAGSEIRREYASTLARTPECRKSIFRTVHHARADQSDPQKWRAYKAKEQASRVREPREVRRDRPEA